MTKPRPAACAALIRASSQGHNTQWRILPGRLSCARPVTVSGGVGGGCAGVGAAGGEGPGEVSGLSGAFDVPAGCLFVAVVVPAAGLL